MEAIRHAEGYAELAEEPSKEDAASADDEAYPGTAGSKLLRLCAGKAEVTLASLEALLRENPDAARERAGLATEEELLTNFSGMVAVGDSALHILIKRVRANEPDKYPIQKAELAAMLSAVCKADPQSVLHQSAEHFEWMKVTRMREKDADLEGQWASQMAVPLAFLRTSGDEPLTKRTRKVAVVAGAYKVTALHLLCGTCWAVDYGGENMQEAISQDCLADCLEVLITAIKAADPSTTLFDGMPADREPSRYALAATPLTRLCSSPLATLPMLDALIDAFPRSVKAIGYSGMLAVHCLLRNKKATLPMLQRLIEASGKLEQPLPGCRSYGRPQFEVVAISEDGKMAELASLATMHQPSYTLKDVSTDRLRPLYMHYSTHPPSRAGPKRIGKGMYVALQGTDSDTCASLAAISCQPRDCNDDEEVRIAATRATELFTLLLDRAPPAELALPTEAAEEGQPPNCSVLRLLAEHPAPVLDAVMKVVPKAARDLWVSTGANARCNPLHCAAWTHVEGRPDRATLELIHALEPEWATQLSGDKKKTPLHFLCTATKLSAEDLDALIRMGPSAATVGDKHGKTPLHDLLETNRPRDLQSALISCYLGHAATAASIADEQGKTPAENLFSSPQLSARDFVPFIQAAHNPLLPCAAISAALRRAAKARANRANLYLRCEEDLRDISARIVRKLPSLSHRAQYEEGKVYPLSDESGGTNQHCEALLLPEELLPPVPALQMSGPLALAVQYEDVDFCSAPMVREYCSAFFTSPCSVDINPPYFERKPLRLPFYKLRLPCTLEANGGYDLPTIKEMHKTYNTLRDSGEIVWAKKPLDVLYLTALVAYRPGIAFKARAVPLVQFCFELLLHLLMILVASFAQPLHGTVQPTEALLYLYALGVGLTEASQLRTGGIQKYVTDPFNLIDVVSCLALSVSFYARVALGPEDVEVAQVAMSLVSISLSFRFLPFLQLSQSVGPLVGVITSMAGLLMVFLFVLLIVLSGFILGMSGLLRDYSEQYSTLISTFLTMFDAMLGSYSFGDFGDAPATTLIAAHVFLVTFVLMCNLLLLNLLIAFLTDAYSKVSEDKDKAFAYSSAAAVVELGDQARQGRLPPPLNVLQSYHIVRNDWLGSSRIALLVFTCTIAPLALALHWALLLLLSPALWILTIWAGERGYWDNQKKRNVPDASRAANETLKNVLGLALLMPASIIAEVGVACKRWTTKRDLQVGEWVVALNTRSHKAVHAKIQLYLDRPLAPYQLDVPEDHTSPWASIDAQYTHAEGGEMTHLVLGRMGFVDEKWWEGWSLKKAQAKEAGYVAPKVARRNMWQAKLTELHRNFRRGEVQAAIQREKDATRAAGEASVRRPLAADDTPRAKAPPKPIEEGEIVTSTELSNNSLDFEGEVKELREESGEFTASVHVAETTWSSRPMTCEIPLKELRRMADLDLHETPLDRLVTRALEPPAGDSFGDGEEDDDEQDGQDDTGDELNSRQQLRRILKIAQRSQEVLLQLTARGGGDGEAGRAERARK